MNSLELNPLSLFSYKTEFDLNARFNAQLDTCKKNAKQPATPSEYAQNLCSLPSSGMPVEHYFDFVFQHLVPFRVPVESPAFVGHMTSGLPAFISPLTRLLVSLHQNVVKQETSEIFTFLEKHAIGRLHQLLFSGPEELYKQQLLSSQGTLGMMTTGGTLANLMALWCARNLLFKTKENFEGIQKEGLANAFRKYPAQKALILGSHFMHYSIEKAADFLGLGANNVLCLPSNQHGQLRLDALKQAFSKIKKTGDLVVAVVGVAGSTEIGSVDDLEAIADICQNEGAFFHVDAAWGGPLLFSPRYRQRLKGIERADSVAIDGHKQLYLPIGTGALLFQNPESASHIERSAHYIIRKDSWDLGRFGLEGSRPANALYLHAALHILGKEGFAFLIERQMLLCLQLYERILSSHAFEAPYAPTMNILTYRYLPKTLRSKHPHLSDTENMYIDKLNVALQNQQRLSGQSFVSRTSLQTPYQNHATYLRCVLANPNTTFADLENMLNEQEKLGETLEKTLTET
ncbi:MAG: aminotransferase class V-fold PLP-dependent enzyme [Proteobacteria bacterium]|nr:aminotransferase class V-fold PLP-dependent enzyme [Cystobacterineae bacterium]MCL2259210.1 aminotransferase class V-fold PLP-dependent enzyme [Cystobacterineae bacterium]MCL2314465.1 aminotransferase class V-fold PLP-dependent enzyme [Pseudomonadota bacterium]